MTLKNILIFLTLTQAQIWLFKQNSVVEFSSEIEKRQDLTLQEWDFIILESRALLLFPFAKSNYESCKNRVGFLKEDFT